VPIDHQHRLAELERERDRARLEAREARAQLELARRAERELRESDQVFRQLTENIREIFWLKDAKDRSVVYISPTYETLWGMSCEAFLADPDHWLRAIHPEDLPRMQKHTRERRGFDRGEVEYRIVPPDGRVRWVRDRSFLIRNKDGEPHRIGGLAEDITERKRLESRMQHVQKMESLGVLAGGIAHDFNNLLLGVLGHADLALGGLTPDAPARSHVEAISRTAERAAELCNQMLAYSGRGKFVVGPIDLSALIADISHLLEVTLSKKAVLQRDLAPDPPKIEGDATQIRQIVMNLLANASDAMGDGEGTIVVRTGVVECDACYLANAHLAEEPTPGLYVCLEVADTGCGMDAETQARIFDPFFTTKFVGRGLGLAAVLGIVRGHGGAIKIYSEPGRGTTIRVLFPAAETPAATDDPPPPQRARGSGGRVLVVDDEETVRDIAGGILESAGYGVLTAVDGLEGVETFRQSADDIDCVLLDLTMPRLGGEEALRCMRRIRPDVPVILSSGYSEREAMSAFDDAGPAAFLQKPYRAGQLIDKIREAMETPAGRALSGDAV
jgi:PAS domain S-box-containing protein